MMEREIWVKKLADRPWPEAAKPYVSRLKPIFTGQKVPPELVWIAEVESSFDPRARSPAGAAGLFQLMPATAKRYGLRTWPLDYRLRPEDSARAAAKYLDYLHAHFKDWRLALAAYNAGEAPSRRCCNGTKPRPSTPSPRICPPKPRCLCPESRPPSRAAKASNSANCACRRPRAGLRSSQSG